MDRHTEKMRGNSRMMENASENILFPLLKSALWGAEPDENRLRRATPAMWRQAAAIASVHGVTPLAYDGMSMLPENLLVPKDIKLAWALKTENAELKFRGQAEVAAHLAAFFASAGIRTVILKGFSLARCYPVPDHRECGDIDVWLCGDYAKGNGTISSAGIKVEVHTAKHSSFTFENTTVENHLTFLDTDRYSMGRILEPILSEIAERDGIVPMNLPGQNLPCRIHAPSADFEALFVMAHSAAHFAGRVRLRHICDWARFLYAHAGKIDFACLESALEKAHLSRFAGIFTFIAVHYLGLGMEYTGGLLRHVNGSDMRIAERIMHDIAGQAFAKTLEGKSSAGILALKTSRFFREHWRFRLVYGCSMPLRILYFIKDHIKHPETILKPI